VIADYAGLRCNSAGNRITGDTGASTDVGDRHLLPVSFQIAINFLQDNVLEEETQHGASSEINISRSRSFTLIRIRH